jgi:amino acid adenylation domain-containing protein
MALYAVYLEHQTLPATSSYQYVDFCHWQTQWLQSFSFETQLAYWQTQLAAPLPVLELPTDYPRPAVQTYRGARQAIPIAPSLTTALRQLSYQQSATLFMTLLAAFKTLLYRYTGQPDLLVGTAMAGRQRVEWEQVLGLFINTLVLRTHPTGSMSFTTFLQQVRDVAVTAYNHQDIPLQILLKEVHPERDRSYNPLFQTFFLLQNFDFPNLELAGLTSTPVAVNTATCKFDLTLELYEQADSLVGWFEYNTDLFNAATIQRLVGHLQTLLADIVTNPEQSLSQLRLLTEAERNQHHNHEHLRPTNAFIEFPSAAIEQSIPARFAQQVNRYPQQIAVQTQQIQLTYLQLNEQANQVAEVLLTQRIDSEPNIGLLFEHDAAMIVALLGVLKAGLTYVPLTPDLPLPRLSHILQDAQIRILLTHNATLTLAKQLIPAPRVLINIEELKPSQVRDTNLAISPDTPAYLLYTSGSTGQPKGVIQNHRNVLHFIRAYTNNLHIHTQDKLSLLSSYSFDAAVMDIFGALLNGATLCPINLKNNESIHAFKQSIQQGITIYHSTPTVYRHLISTLTTPDRFPQLRLIVLGGEEVYQTDVESYQQYFAEHCIFVNGLGPSESTVTLQYFLNKQSVNPQPTVPIGYPVAATEIVLLSDQGEPTELYGEIAINSAHVALGYWQQSLLTQAVFRQDQNGRLYRTGDMGRLRIDGSLEFAGRKDSQVKLRGHRIELGEIEVILKQHPAVQEVVALLREDQPGLKQLVAYIVPASELVPTIDELRQFLKNKLPSYMVPAAMVVLTTIPLLPNGKVNYHQLPAPTLETTDWVAPRDNFEQQLAQIWEKILGTVSISVYDNFFEIGGDSLSAITLINQIDKRFGKHLGKRLPGIELSQVPTIAEQAELLRGGPLSHSNQVLEAIQTQGTNLPLFFICPSHYVRALARVLGPQQPVYRLEILGLQTQYRQISALNIVTEHFIQEIQMVQSQGPYFIIGFCGQAKLAVEVARQLQQQGQTIAFLGLIQALPYYPRWQWYQHWAKLLQVGPIYLWRKIKQKLTSRRIQIKQLLLRKLGEKLPNNRWVEKKLPRALEYTLFVNSFFHTLNNYSLPPYYGDITVFYQSEWCTKLALQLKLARKVAAGTITVQEIPAQEHDKLFEPPRLEILGKRVQSCLEQVTGSDSKADLNLNTITQQHDIET